MSAANAAFFDGFADRVGAVIAGRRTYDIARAWGGKGPLPPVPLFVLTHEPPAADPSTDPPYVFVTEGIERAVEFATAAAGDRDVSLMGSYAVKESLRAGLLEEITLDQVPVLLGRGVRLLDGFDEPIELDIVRVVESQGVTHLTYRVVR
jgi:dihydrofolate reductase